MVSQHKNTVFRNLVGQFYVALSQCFFINIRFIQELTVDIHIAVLIDVHPVAGIGNISLDQNTVVVIKSDNVTLFQISDLARDHDVAVCKGGGHGGAVNLQYRHPERRDKDSCRCDCDQRKHRAPEDTPVTRFIALTLQFSLEILERRTFDRRFCG